MLFSSRSLTSSGNPVMNTVRTSSAAGREAWGRRRAQQCAAPDGHAPAASCQQVASPAGRAGAVGGRGGLQGGSRGWAAPTRQLQGRLPAASLRACGRQRRCRWGWSVVKSRGRLYRDAVERSSRLLGKSLQVGTLHGCQPGLQT